jgi:hypothetical protein
MARQFWVSAACLAAVLAPLSLRAQSSTTPQPKAAATPAATVQATAAPSPAKTPAATLSPTPAKGAAQAASATAQGQALSGTAKTLSGTAKTVSGTAASTEANHKSEALAEIIAWVPGIAIHGAGHMYAGSWMHGLGLFALEGACVYEGMQVVNRGNFNKFNVSGGKIPTGLSGAYTDAGIGLVCAMGMLWTWLDDVSGATVAVDDYNKIQDQAAGPHAQLQLLPTRDGAMLALSTQF